MFVLQKERCGDADAQTEIFKGRKYFAELGHFDEHFAKNKRKRVPAGKYFGAFCPRYS